MVETVASVRGKDRDLEVPTLCAREKSSAKSALFFELFNGCSKHRMCKAIVQEMAEMWMPPQTGSGPLLELMCWKPGIKIHPGFG